MPLDAACSHSVFIRNSRQFLFFFALSKVHSKQFISRCQLQWILHCFSALFFFIFTFFLLFTKTSSAHSFLTVFAEHSMSDDDVKEKFFSPCRQRRRKRRKILKASVNNTQVRCKSNVLQVVFLYFSVVQPQGVGVGFFSGGCEREKRKIGRFSFTFTILLWVLVTEQ